MRQVRLVLLYGMLVGSAGVAFAQTKVALTFERILSTQKARANNSGPLLVARFRALIQDQKLARPLSADELRQLHNSGMEPELIEELKKADNLATPPAPPKKPEPVKPDPVKPDLVKPGPVKPDPLKPPPVKPKPEPVKPEQPLNTPPVKPPVVADPMLALRAEAYRLMADAEKAASETANAADVAAASHLRDRVDAASTKAVLADADAARAMRALQNLPGRDPEVEKARANAQQAAARAAEDRRRAEASHQEASLDLSPANQPLNYAFLRMLIDAGFHPALVNRAVETRKVRLTLEEQRDLREASGWAWMANAMLDNAAPVEPAALAKSKAVERISVARIEPLFDVRVARSKIGRMPPGQFQFEVEIDRAGTAKSIREIVPDGPRPADAGHVADLFLHELMTAAFKRHMSQDAQPVEAVGPVVCLVFVLGGGNKNSKCAVLD